MKKKVTILHCDFCDAEIEKSEPALAITDTGRALTVEIRVRREDGAIKTASHWICPRCGEKVSGERHTINRAGYGECDGIAFSGTDAQLGVIAIGYVPRLLSQLSEERDKVRRLTEALTPSIEKKGEFTARFSFDTPAEGKVFVPWVTVKEIMATILAASALDKGED